MKTLRAWQAYDFAQRCFNKLNELKSPGDFEDWDIYWLSGLSATRSIWDTLKKELDSDEHLKQSIWIDYNEGPATWEVHQSFTRAQRHQTLHEWIWDIIVIDTTSNDWLGGGFISQQRDLVFRYPTPIDSAQGVDERLQGEDPIRLLGIALQFQHENLSIIEMALLQKIGKPFTISDTEKLYSESPFFNDSPKFYR